MSNMSYCRFRNTLSDLHDCAQALGADDGEIDNNLSDEERRARRALIELCTEISDACEDFDHDAVTNTAACAHCGDTVPAGTLSDDWCEGCV